MLFVSLSRPFLDKDFKDVDGVELRLDLFSEGDWNFVRNLPNFPVMFTLRKASQGGRFAGSEEEREAKIIDLLKLKPPFFDLESDMRAGFLQKTLSSYPATKFILSYHNFEKTPEDLDRIFNAMVRFPAFGYKIAAASLSANDALRMLLFSKNHKNLSAICLGEKGEFGRVLGAVVGNCIDYACASDKEKIAPGQLSVSDLVDIYRYRKLHSTTQLYGLIGDPVKQSRGHIYHNDAFFREGRDAVYVKIQVKAEELSTFFPLARKLGFQGFSVTMPLKESVLPYIHEMDFHAESCQAVNTLSFHDLKMRGTNTDGRGALDAIEKKLLVKDKEVVLLGAGGAARGIAFEAKKRGAKVWILNRTLARAEELASLLCCRAGSLSHFPSRYDILVNCSPESMPVDEHLIQSNAIVMDIVYAPKETEFLKSAKLKGCEIIYGEEMFFNQALLQTKFWT